MEKIGINEQYEQKKALIKDKILDELGALSRTYDNQNTISMGESLGKWSERADIIRRGEKLSRLEITVREIALDIARRGGLSDRELDRFMDEIFEPSKRRNRDDD